MENTSIEKIEFKKVRDFGEKINITVSFIRQNFKNLFKSLLFIIVPTTLIIAILSSIYKSIILDSLVNKNFFQTGFQGLPSSFFPFLLFIVVLSFIQIALVHSTVYAYIMLYVERGPNFKVKDVWQGVKKSFVKILISTIFSFLLFLLGFFLFFIPGIYIAIVLSLVSIIIVYEKINFFQALGRAFKLIYGKWWSTFGLLLITLIIMGIIFFLFWLPYNLIISAYTFNSINHQTTNSNLFIEILLIIVSTIYTIFIYMLFSLPLTALAFQYFNLVERKESAGLMEKINTVGSSSKKNEGTY